MGKVEDLEKKIQHAREMQLYCLEKYQEKDWPDLHGAALGISDWFREELILQKELDELTGNQNQG